MIPAKIEKIVLEKIEENIDPIDEKNTKINPVNAIIKNRFL
jgi:hypothetical protein